MKPKLLIILLAIAGFFSIQNSFSKHRIALRKAFDASPVNGVYKYSGKLNGRIPVFVWFLFKDGVIKGEVTYLKTARRVPITLLGMVYKYGGIQINEFGKNGVITGTFSGNFDKAAFTGSWYAPGSDKELKFNLLRKDTVLTHADTTLHEEAGTGVFRYEYGKTGAAGEINIQVIKPGICKADIGCTTAAPAYNQANVEVFTAQMTGNTFYYKVKEGDCKFRIILFRDFVVIDWLTDNISECGFGFNANIEGVFMKVNNKAKFTILR